MVYCHHCLEKQLRINELEEEIACLKKRLRYQERTAKEGFFRFIHAFLKAAGKTKQPNGASAQSWRR
jgi:hypothetical protein